MIRPLLILLIGVFAVACASSAKKPDETTPPDPVDESADDGDTDKAADEATPAGALPDPEGEGLGGVEGGVEEEDDADEEGGGTRGIGGDEAESAEPEEEEPPGAQ